MEEASAFLKPWYVIANWSMYQNLHITTYLNLTMHAPFNNLPPTHTPPHHQDNFLAVMGDWNTFDGFHSTQNHLHLLANI